MQDSIPEARQLYYEGFDARVNEVLRGVAVNLSAMGRYERRGYDAAMRAQADADADGYITRQAALGQAVERD